MKWSHFFTGCLFTLEHVEMIAQMIVLDETVSHFNSPWLHRMFFIEIEVIGWVIVDVGDLFHKERDTEIKYKYYKIRIISICKHIGRYSNPSSIKGTHNSFHLPHNYTSLVWLATTTNLLSQKFLLGYHKYSLYPMGSISTIIYFLL